ncbi:MAG: oligosaccharide flippase family protein [Pseudomonadales bacterium]|nr:oligosaccharide flippase family protein [Pseudomonadales bacterium]
MKLGKLLVRGALLRSSYTFLSMAIAFLMMPLFIHNLGDDWYGIWTVISGFIGVYFVLDLGVTSAVSRYTSAAVGKNDKTEINTIVNTGLIIFLCLSVLVTVVTFIISYFSTVVIDTLEYQTVVSQVILVAGLSVALEFPFNAFAGLTEAKSRYDQLVYVRAFTLSVGAIINYIQLTHGVGILGITIAGFVMARISNFLYWYLAKKNFPGMIINLKLATKDHAKKLFSFSFWSFLISLASTLPFRANPLIIAAFISPSAVTVYVVGQRLVEYTNRFLNQATNILTPTFTQHYERGEFGAIREKLLFMVRINSVGAMVALFGLIGLAEALIVEWVGDEYLEGYGVVVIRIFGLMATFIFSNSNNILYATKKHKFLAALTIVEGVALMIISILLIDEFGILAVAIGATVPALITRFIILPYYVAKAINLNPLHLFGAVAKSMLVLVPVGSLFVYWSREIYKPEGYLDIAILGASVGILLAALGLFTQFKRDERSKLLSALPFVGGK